MYEGKENRETETNTNYCSTERELKWFIEEEKIMSTYCKVDKEESSYWRSMAYKILSGAAAEFGLDEIGTHTLRKTYGYHMYMQTKNIALLMEIFNHSSEKVTLRYIGVNQDAMDKAMTRFKI
ncbi:tyrosine-type recombinase/integrase [Bacillus sp. A17A.1]